MLDCLSSKQLGSVDFADNFPFLPLESVSIASSISRPSTSASGMTKEQFRSNSKSEAKSFDFEAKSLDFEAKSLDFDSLSDSRFREFAVGVSVPIRVQG